MATPLPFSPPSATRLAATALAILALSSMSALAAVMPYSDDFGDDTLGTSTPSEPPPENGTFTPAPNSGAGNIHTAGIGSSATFSTAWTVEADGADPAKDYQVVLSANKTAGSNASTGRASSYESFTGLNVTDFQLSVQFNIDALSAISFTSVGIFARADSGTGNFASSGYHLRYEIFGGAPTGSIVLQRNGTVLGSETRSAGNLTVNTNGSTSYTLTLTGTTSGSDFLLDGNLTDGTNTISISQYSDATPIAGISYTAAGMSAVIVDSTTGGVAPSLNVDFDNFNLVPEPAGFTLVLGAAGLLLLRRRRV